jgi:hypothetical protein
MVGTWLRPATQSKTMFKIGRSWATCWGFGGPHGSSANPPQTNLDGAYPDTWLNLLESRAWRCGTCVHACTKCVAQVGGFVTFIAYTFILLNIKYCTVQIQIMCFFFRLKINHSTSWNGCAIILVLGVDVHNYTSGFQKNRKVSFFTEAVLKTYFKIFQEMQSKNN